MKLCKDCKRYGKCGRFYSSMSNYAEECKDFDEIKPTHFERIKAMSVEEMAEYFALGKHPNVPCNVCKYDEGLFCTKEDCNPEYKIRVFKEWLESEVQEDEM